jgi:alpha-tubulin suppressor-like RCC1 family protein
MARDDINYRFTENGVVYDFYDVFVPAENFRQPALWVWGNNGQGQLGTNTTDGFGKPSPVTTLLGGTNWKSVACGDTQTAAIKTDGTLWTWGSNNNGSLGVNDTRDRSTPVTTLLGGTNWKSISVGLFHMAAIKTDGTLWGWGDNRNGVLGVNDITSRSTPVTTLLGGTNWKSVSCGNFYVTAIKTDGTLWVWGDGERGLLGTNNTTSRSTPVTTFAGGTNWKSVSGGAWCTAAIKTDGTLWIWGFNSSGQLGVNDTTQRNTPVTTLLGGNNWKSVATGGYFSSAIKTDGTLWLWGKNGSGNLGVNDTRTRSTPVTTLLGGNNWKQVSISRDTAGVATSSAIKTDGTLWTWGENGVFSGQLGVNDDITRSTPVTTLRGRNNWKQVSCGDEHMGAIQYTPDP